ncbi:hypothetical protein PybrP1_009605 [[Pythium] brassicae (nom. inval.)]|nr:hypothetical protein PybrP1_009605 [[Pythium] brassicae (nom. inval.)]
MARQATDGGVWPRLQQLAAAARDSDALAVLLADGELPALVLTAAEQLREQPPAAPARVQLVVDLCRGGSNALLARARDWALDSLLELPRALERDGGEGGFSGRDASPALQQLQTALCTAVTPASVLDELQEAVFSAFALQQAPLAPAAFTRALELCAASVRDDLECALFLDVMLAGREVFTAPPALLERLMKARTGGGGDGDGDAEAPGRLFEQLSATAKVRVWGNHLPSWEAQLQEWLLEVHATPFAAVDAIVWRASDSTEPGEEARAALQRHAYLYAVLLEWFARHRRFLASPRTRELLRCLSEATRRRGDHRAFGRSLVDALGLAELAPTAASLTPRQRTLAFARAAAALAALRESLGDADDTQLLFEWMGVAERPQLLCEALELLLEPPAEADATTGTARAGAAALVGWFYAFTTGNASAASIAAAALETAAALGGATLLVGSAWLQRARSAFASLPRLRLRLAWVWLLRTCCAAADSLQSDAAVADALESLEYAFRRFAPAKPAPKRAFQVEVLAQLLADLEWRWAAVAAAADRNARLELRERVDVPVAWLQKLVRLLQTEQPPPRLATVLAKHASRSASASLSEQLASRLARLTSFT